MADFGEHVEIGYLKKCEPWKLESRYFPCKVGGKPAWLDLKNISIDLKCGYCLKPCIFLCQIYAPIPVSESKAHRTLYVFMCTDPECCKVNKSGNFKVYRCQLPLLNDYYPSEDPIDKPDWHPEITVEKFSRVCIVCGASSSFKCSKCKRANYCSKEHQISDWRAGHNKSCATESCIPSKADVLFSEFEIEIEPEICDDNDDEKPDRSEKSEEEKLKEYEKLLSQGRGGTLQDVPAEMMEMLALGKEDKYFRNYKKRLEICTDQVIRYELGGKPLLVSEPDIEVEIPNCEYCNGPRQFEFQIVSTLLTYLNVDNLDKSIDWGTLVIYTCKDSCDGGPVYKPEFLYKQDIL